jgi:hypothetical protein
MVNEEAEPPVPAAAEAAKVEPVHGDETATPVMAVVSLPLKGKVLAP